LTRFTALQLAEHLESLNTGLRIISTPESLRPDYGILLQPDAEQWAAIYAKGGGVSKGGIADLLRTATSPKNVGTIGTGANAAYLTLGFPESATESLATLQAFPVSVGGKVVPLSAVMPFKQELRPPAVFRKDLQEITIVSARAPRTSARENAAAEARVKVDVAKWLEDLTKKGATFVDKVRISFDDPRSEVTAAVKQLTVAFAVAVLLILVVLVMQFNSIADSAVVLLALPFGILGAIAALAIFKSSVSLNSVLGIILLNGIAVNNSILIVDLTRRKIADGIEPLTAAVAGASERLRPILITSLTTILGMMPIALGIGEGGRILQPLGIAVSCGLWISMVLTIFFVPAIYAALETWRQRRSKAMVT
jgi:HAE1 family hydrophobic/amphiphilic exporter-1